MIQRSLALSALLAGTCLSSHAHAQVTQLTYFSPNIRSSVDANGVDLTTGQFQWVMPEVSVGDVAHGLNLIRMNGAHNYIMTQYNNTDGTVTLNLGGSSQIFSSVVAGTPKSGDGSTLSVKAGGSYYVSHDGTQIKFEAPFGNADYYYGNPDRLATFITYPDGNQLQLGYGEHRFPNYGGYFGRLEWIISTAGFKLKFNYVDDTSYTLASIQAINGAYDQCNSTTPCTYSWPTVYFTSANVGGNLQETITDPRNGQTRITYDSSNRITGIKRPTSTVDDITVSYDASGRVHTLTRDGSTWTYAWTVSGTTLTATVTDPLSHTNVTTADINYHVILTDTDANNHTTTYTPDTYGRITKIAYPEGNYVQYGYDGRGNVQSFTAVSKTPGTPVNITASQVFPSTCTNTITCNKPTSATDPLGNVTNYTYDPTHGGILTVTGPAVGGVQPQIRYSYTALQAYWKTTSTSIVASGHPTYRLTGISQCRTTASCTGTADEIVTSIGYGPQAAGTPNNLLPILQSTGAGNGSLTASSSQTYDMVGNLYTGTDPLGNVTRYHYDMARDLTGVVGPDPDGTGSLKNRAQRTTYNADGLVTLTEQGTVVSQSDTDWANFVTLQQVAIAYDSAHRKSQVSAQASGTTYSVVQYGYDAASRLQCTAQRMNPSTFASLPSSACTLGAAGSYGPDRIAYNTYDNADELTQVTSGYGVSGLQRNERTYTYSNNGKVKMLADANNNLTTYVYDGFDRLSQTRYPSPTLAGSSNTSDYEQLGYDAAGNVTSRRLRDGTSIGYGYDALNRMSSKTLPSGEHGVTYAYDNLGHPTTITGATMLSYGWDALGRMTSETQAYGSVAYLYDLGNRRTRLTWQDGTYLTYDYDNVDEMTAIHENGAAANLVAFSYDDLGQRKTRTLANGTSTTYGYDAISRLTSLALAGGTNTNTATLSNYSPAGEIGSRANSNDAFAWTQGANVNRGYTINGLNQFATIAGATQGYDGRGNLTSSGGTTYAYTSENLLKSVSTGQTLSYDPIGRLGEYDAPTATRFVYDGSMISEELNTNGGVLRRYVFGPTGDEPIVWYEGSTTATKRYMDQDERGSVTRITNADGSTYAVNGYDEYGIPGASNQGRFGYTGQAWLPEIGLAYYKARIYSPTLGRFMQTDPIGYGDGPNWYNYVHSDPINAIDLSGTATGAPPPPPSGPEIIVNGQYPGPSVNFGQINNWVEQFLASHDTAGHSRFHIEKGTPPKSKPCIAGGVSFRAPNDFDPNAIAEAGSRGGLSGANSSVGHYGTYDFQRVKTSSGTTFYSQYTPVSNLAVGFYLWGAGYSRTSANLISNGFASAFSSNGASKEQDQFRNLAYDIAQGKAKIVCYPQ